MLSPGSWLNDVDRKNTIHQGTQEDCATCEPSTKQLIGNLVIRDLLIGPITDVLVSLNGDRMAMAETFTAHGLWAIQDIARLRNRLKNKVEPQNKGNKNSIMTKDAIMGMIPLLAFDALYTSLPKEQG